VLKLKQATYNFPHRNFRWYYFWTLAIYVVIGLPGYAIPSFPGLNLINFDKFVHASIFGLQTFLAFNAISNSNGMLKGFIQEHPVFSVLLTGLLQAGVSELFQSWFFIQRSADVGDFIANSVGIFAVSVFWFRKV
jgi:hypothetical protein